MNYATEMLLEMLLGIVTGRHGRTSPDKLGGG